jgi:hypothetical protein
MALSKTTIRIKMRFLLFVLMSLIPSISYSDKPERFAHGRVLFMPRGGLPAHELQKIIKAKKIGQSDLYVAEVEHGSEKSVVARLSHNPHFKFAELDLIIEPETIPNDPYYFNAWHLPKIGADAAWDMSQGAGVTIAILDSGADPTHPDLSSRLVPGWNFFDNNSNTADVHGHGTIVAGTAAAASNNSVGVAAVSGQSRILPIRVTDLTGSGYTSMIASGLIYAADHGAKVANVSFANMPSRSAVISAAQYMKDKGGLVVVAAGNSGIDEGFTPTTSLIPVSATDGNDMKASWSSYGSYVALSAPGVGIWSTANGSGYGSYSGTSVASPVAAGVVALVFAANASLKNTDVEKLIYSTAVDLGDMGRDIYYGYGRVNAYGAVSAARTAISTVDTQAPSVSITSPADGSTASGLVPVDVSASDNVGVSRVELRANGNSVAIDSSSPFAFTWDSTGSPNGTAKLVAYAYDAAGNFAASAPVSVNVSNTVILRQSDTTPPVIKIVNPVAGNVSGNVAISISASDDSGAAGIKLSIYVDDVLKASGAGSTLGYNWNTKPKNLSGLHTVKAVATDATGNSSSTSVTVNVVR